MCGNILINGIYDVNIITSNYNNRSVACEDQTLSLQCPKNQNLNIITANYGRSDKYICPLGPILTTNCLSNQANYLMNQCNNQNACNVLASNSLPGGDPCQNTLKYLGIFFIFFKITI
jgi:hypothetical protein